MFTSCSAPNCRLRWRMYGFRDEGLTLIELRATWLASDPTCRQPGLAANRSQFYYDIASGPFCGYNRPSAKSSQTVIINRWLRRPILLKKITIHVPVMRGDDDQIVPLRRFPRRCRRSF
jgi:hypothetical protein